MGATRRRDAAFRVIDAGSVNGTFVERKRAPERGTDGIVVNSGDSIRFGAVTTTFLDAKAALEFLTDNFY